MLFVDVDEDALTRALFGRLDNPIESVFGDSGHTFGSCRVGDTVEELLATEVLGGFLHVVEAVVHSKEDVGRNFSAEPVARAQILVDPDLHHNSCQLLLMLSGASAGPPPRTLPTGTLCVVTLSAPAWIYVSWLTSVLVTNRQHQPATAISDFPALYARTARFSLGTPRNIQLADGGRRVLFCRSKAPEDSVLCLWSLDVESGTEALIVDPGNLPAADRELPPAERARRERARESASGIVAYSLDAEGRRACFTLAGQLFVVDLSDGALHHPGAADSVFDPRFNRQGTAIAYSNAGALRLCVVAADGSGVDTELRSSQDPLVSHGRAEFVAAEEMQRSRGYWWSPDGTAILATRVDETPVQQWWIADPAHPERPANTVRYPAAGTTNATVQLELVDLNGNARTIDWSDGGRFEYLADVVWQPDHEPLIVRQRRDQRLVSIAEVALGEEPASVIGEASDSLSDPLPVVERHSITDDIWVELMPGSPQWCSAGLLTIEDGAAARSLLLNGEALTPLDLHVRSIVGLIRTGATSTRADAATGDDTPTTDGTTTADGTPTGDDTANAGDTAVLVTAWTEPTEQHLIVVPLPGSGRELVTLTTDAGVHNGVLSGSTLVTTSTGPDHAGSRVAVHDLDRSLSLSADAAGITDHSADPGFAADPFFCTLGKDQLASAVFLPSDHNGSDPLPVLLDPYGGPHAQRVLKNHNPHLVSRWFAEHGYAVVVTDGRGTPGRGPAWEREVWGNLADPVLDDQVAALDAALDQHEFLDGNRVGIRGWSFGGFLAALAVLRRPDRFHAALAGAPVTTWHLYDTHYTERYLGHPTTHPEHYRQSDLWTDSETGPVLDRLERPLLLIHGLADDNVVAAHTLRFSTALLATGSPHRVLPLSGVTHMTPQAAVAENLLRLQLDFLSETIGAPAVGS